MRYFLFVVLFSLSACTVKDGKFEGEAVEAAKRVDKQITKDIRKLTGKTCEKNKKYCKKKK